MITYGHLGMLLLGAAGFALLASAMDRHDHDIHGHALPAASRRRRQLAGAAGLLLSLVGLVHEMGSGVGAYVWLLLLTVCALAVVLVVTFRPRWLSGRFKRR